MDTSTAVLPRVSRPLNQSTLHLHRRVLPVPEYDRARLDIGVVHIGLGGFHRAHQAVYFDDLAGRGISDWGIAGVNLRRLDLIDAVESQDGLFTVVERGENGDAARVIGSLLGGLAARRNPEAVIDRLVNPATRLVTLTITADGYDVDKLTQVFNPSRADLRRELAARAPSTAYGFIVEALARRRARGVAPFTVLSCDNLPDSGACAKAAVVSFATRRDPELARWIDNNVAFPSSMVDRITPKATESDGVWIQSRFGIEDRCPVVTEPFSQWILEDAFCNERPPLDEVGVQFVSDVRPYKLVKGRMLNGTHSAIAYLGLLCGHETTSDVMADPVLSRYVESLLREEIAPLLDEPAGMDLDEYHVSLRQRLSNARLDDQLTRLAERGSTKIPSYVLPTLYDARDKGAPHRLLVLAVAGWVHYLGGGADAARRSQVTDSRRATLRPLARRAAEDPRPLLAQTEVFGALGEDEDFCAELRQTLVDLRRLGARDLVRSHLSAEDQVAA